MNKQCVFGLCFSFLAIVGGCQERLENETAVEVIELKRAPYTKAYEDDKQGVARFVEKYLNDMFTLSASERNEFWESSILVNTKDIFLRSNWPKQHLIEEPPQLLGIRKISDGVFNVVLSFDYLAFPLKIMNLKVAHDETRGYYFIDLLSENLSSCHKREVAGITYYYAPGVEVDASLEKANYEFNVEMSAFFEVPPKPFTVIVAQKRQDYYALMGYEYYNRQSLDNEQGGRALPHENIVFSGNGTPYYPHEVVHLYSTPYGCHEWIDEGTATYFGGSGGFALQSHIEKLAGRLDELDFSDLLQMANFDSYTDYRYAIGGLLIDLAIREYGGKPAVMQLLNTGRSDEDFYRAVEEVFGVNKSELDGFLKQKIKEYVER